MSSIDAAAKKQADKKERNGEGWHPFIALLLVLLIAAVLTYVIPAGAYERVQVDGTTRVDVDSFAYTDTNPTSVYTLFASLFVGFNNGSSIIAMIMFIMGGFGVLQEIGLLDAMVKALTKSMQKRSIGLLAIVIMVAIGLNHGFTGCREMDMVFIPLLVPMCIALGYDSMTAMIIVFVGSCAGFTAAMANPSFTAIAHGVAELPIYSAFGYRAFCTAVMMATGFVFVMRYIKKIKADPSASVVKDLPIEKERQALYGGGNFDVGNTGFTTRMKLGALVFLAFFVLMIIGFLMFDFGYAHLSVVWICIAIFPALICGKGPNEICRMWVKGVSDNAVAFLIIIFAQAVLYVLTDGGIIDTIIYYLSHLIQNIGAGVAAVGIYIIQTIINLPIPSGSGQAAVTMPILTPLADIAGVNRQVACLASQFGDGLTNYIYPTNGILMAAVAAAGIPYKTWVKWFLPLFAIWAVLLGALVALAQLIDLGPF